MSVAIRSYRVLRHLPAYRNAQETDTSSAPKEVGSLIGVYEGATRVFVGQEGIAHQTHKEALQIVRYDQVRSLRAPEKGSGQGIGLTLAGNRRVELRIGPSADQSAHNVPEYTFLRFLMRVVDDTARTGQHSTSIANPRSIPALMTEAFKAGQVR